MFPSLTKLITREETFWKQRSKHLWLKEGNRNTRFFHAKPSHRHQINSIQKLRQSDGTWTDSVNGVQQCILEYFQNLFTSMRPLLEDIQRGVEHLPVVVDRNMAEDLQQHYMVDEVTKGLFNMGGKKYINLKLDISKAYDRVEWSFLQQVLGKLGFLVSFIELIMLCISFIGIPPAGKIKINFDGALLDGGVAIGVGIIAHDPTGVCLAWQSLHLVRKGLAFVVEAYAARAPTLLAWSLQWQEVLIEGDCALLISRLSTNQ
ncbi:hypothetical protein Sango_2735800 [Sesamum angolense]|uniref:RNase H type-1 domain-containing protein n=1 Tax=Sesamum angolense TaxID=2727404 RepID=A0AAE1T9X2_9LAMI|nr:hypothetical protein Sango_2735800 [Sesamum angolense]